MSLIAADCYAAVLSGGNFESADLRQANLARAAVPRRHFRSAIQSEADLSNALGYGSMFVDADLRGAILKSADLNGSDLKRAKVDEGLCSAWTFNACMPDDFDHVHFRWLILNVFSRRNLQPTRRVIIFCAAVAASMLREATPRLLRQIFIGKRLYREQLERGPSQPFGIRPTTSLVSAQVPHTMMICVATIMFAGSSTTTIAGCPTIQPFDWTVVRQTDRGIARRLVEAGRRRHRFQLYPWIGRHGQGLHCPRLRHDESHGPRSVPNSGRCVLRSRVCSAPLRAAPCAG